MSLRLTTLVLCLLAGSARAQDAAPTPSPSPGLQFDEQVVVTAGRSEQRVSDLPVQVTVLDGERVRRSPSQTAADLLSEVPSFSTARTSSSRVVGPATTPAGLRNLGGGSASRALVLVDGVPLNDPFFGWIPWSLVARSSIERIEIVPAAGAGAWGNQALGGAVNIITKRARTTSFDLDTRLGTLGTVDVEGAGAWVGGPWSVAPRASFFDTDGYVALGEAYRGPIDTRSRSKSTLLGLRVEYGPSATERWFAEGGYLDDHRETGTPLSLDDGRIATARAAGDLEAFGGALHVGGFGQWRDASTLRGSVNAERTTITPNRDQFDIPSSSLGLGATWTRPAGARHVVNVGLDLQRTAGEVHDDSRYVSGHFTRRGAAGGSQVLFGVFGQDTLVLGPRWRAVAGARLDYWRVFDGVDFLQDLDTDAVLKDDAFATRDVWVLDPNLGLVFRASDRLGLRGSLYRTFRAPSPAELYRTAQSGTRGITVPNPNLEPERVTLGADLGFDYAAGSRVTLRASGFWNDFRDAITEITTGAAGELAEEVAPCGLLAARGTCRQKQNIDRLRHRGIEAEVRVRPSASVSFAASYVYGSGLVTEAVNAPQLVGKRLRRVPVQQASLRAEYASEHLLTASLLARYFGDRFADDLNVGRVDDAIVVDLSLSRRINDRFEVYAIAENLLDTAFEVDNSNDGIEYGHPRWVHVGVRFRWEGRGAATRP